MDSIYSVSETSDGGYIVGGDFESDIDLGDGLSLTNKGNYDGMLIKYDSEGNLEWTKGIGGTGNDSIKSVSETTDGGYIVGGNFRSKSIDLENGISLANRGNNDGIVIKYSSSGEVEWAKGIGGNYNEFIIKVSETTDGGYIVGGYFDSSSIDLGNGISLSNSNSVHYDGMLIKYGSSGEVEWAKGIGETADDQITSIVETTDGGYIVGGYFKSSSIDLGNGISLSNSNSGYYDGMLIKYDSEGNAEWTKGIGGTEYDEITSVSECSDGGYVVAGYFQSSSIDLGNGEILTNRGSDDGMIIKYSSSGEVEWAKGIGGEGYDDITSVSETTDGGYVVAGYFKSSSID